MSYVNATNSMCPSLLQCAQRRKEWTWHAEDLPVHAQRNCSCNPVKQSAVNLFYASVPPDLVICISLYHSASEALAVLVRLAHTVTAIEHPCYTVHTSLPGSPFPAECVLLPYPMHCLLAQGVILEILLHADVPTLVFSADAGGTGTEMKARVQYHF